MHRFTQSPPNRAGVFSPQTSSDNFCEIDYEVTVYIAEFVNTLTNLAYIYMAAVTLAPGRPIKNVLTWPLANVSLLLVGIGSAAFHATLKHYAQMADELSMYAIITTLHYRVWTIGLFSSPIARRSVASALMVSTAAVAYCNITSSDGASTTLHLTLFITLVTTFWPRALYLIYAPIATEDPFRKGRSSRALAGEVRKRRLSSFRWGAVYMLLGFTLWLIDGIYCEELRAIRAVVGLPLAWILELHGAWHILTAMSAASFVRLVDDLTR